MIDDTRSAAFVLADHRLETDGVEIDAPVERRQLSELDGDVRDRAARFLRERGCFGYEGQWLFEEQLITVELPVRLDADGPRSAPVLRSDPEASPGPYR